MDVGLVRLQHAGERLQVVRASGDRRRWNGAVADEMPVAVDVLQHPLEQFGALRDAGRDLLPIVGLDQQR